MVCKKHTYIHTGFISFINQLIRKKNSEQEAITLEKLKLDEAKMV